MLIMTCRPGWIGNTTVSVTRFELDPSLASPHDCPSRFGVRIDPVIVDRRGVPWEFREYAKGHVGEG
jgi:hypothetical protein